MIIYVNEKQVEVDEQATVAALLEQLGFPDRGGDGLRGAAPFWLGHEVIRRCATRGADGGARWLTPN